VHMMDPALLCQAFFTLGAAAVLGGALVPPFRQQFMEYGTRGSRSETSASATNPPKGSPKGLFSYIGSFQVPHSWFTQYYVVSVASSIFWAAQILTHGRVFRLLASHSQQHSSGTMTVNQVFIVWTFMAVQGARRLYESITLTKPSQSKMWIGAWTLGIAYYIVMGVSVWIEGICELQYQVRFSSELLSQSAALDTSADVMHSLELGGPSRKTFIAVPIFLLASGIQHDCHEYLASLEKYTLPQHPMFQAIVCPHYTSECLIYIAIAIAAAPEGSFFNRTMLSGLLFIFLNLAVTADSTRKWSVEKFGAEKLKNRWRMVPYIY